MSELNNGDMPAQATTLDISEYKGTINCPYNKPLTGLTKREAFAMAAMQCLVSNNALDGTDKDFAEIAVSQADALLKELSNVQT